MAHCQLSRTVSTSKWSITIFKECLVWIVRIFFCLFQQGLDCSYLTLYFTIGLWKSWATCILGKPIFLSKGRKYICWESRTIVRHYSKWYAMSGKCELHLSNDCCGNCIGELCCFYEAREIVYDYHIGSFSVPKRSTPTICQRIVGNGVGMRGSTCWHCILQHA